ncbi:MAG: PQQ-dependent sugar dehydrogenase, partial [Dehalococcoidia bacterium]|nr:PQQ-dependent sugar dehydrogenase [Dehalococcoidia bacterium]
GIPSDNPFAASPNGERPEIWAYGLRNPWRFSFDRETGELWVGDVGQNAWEEIDLVERGGNYGWNTLEASHCFRPSTGCNSTGTVLPIAEYGRSSGCSVTGGYVTRGPSLPELNGVYVYADFCTGLIWGLRPDGQQPVESALIGTANGQVSSFGEDADGNVYLLMFGGKVHRITPSE